MLAGSGIGITGAASTVVRDNLTKNVVLISNDKGKIAPSSLSINQLQGTIVGGATTITDYDLTPNKVVISDADGKIGTSLVSNIEVGYLFGTNDSIQNQLDGKQNNLSNAAGTGEVLLESDSLKRIYGVSPINIETFNANLEVSIDESAFGNITCNTLVSNFDIQCGDLQAQSIYGGAAIQIQQNIDNAIAAAALTAQSPLSISNENLLSIDLSSIQSQIDGKANQATTYTKTEVDNGLALKANQATTYTKTEVDSSLALKANQSTTYTKTEVNDRLLLKANQSTTYTKTEVDDKLVLKANQSTTYTKTEIDNNLLLKADQLTTYTKTEIDNSLLLKQNKFILGEIPSNTSRLFDLNDNKFRAIHVSSPLSIETTNDAYLTINADTYSKAEVDNSLFLKADKSTTYTKTEVDTQFANLIDTAPDALNTLNELAAALNDDANYAATVENQLASKQNVLSNVPGTGQILLESDYLKRIFAVSPLSVSTYLNLDDPDDPKNANIELSIDESAFNQITCNTLVSNFDIQCGDLTAQSLYGGAALQIQQNIDNAIAAAALTAQAPLSISNENVLSIDLSTIQTQIDGKQNILATGNPSDPDHVKILENGSIPAIMLYPPSAANAGITLDTAMNPGAITIDYSVLQGTVAQRAWTSQVVALEEVVENPGNGYYYLRTPANSSLIVSNGDNTGSVAAFNFDGSSVLHGNVTILGNITNTALTSQLNAKQNILSTGNPNDPSHVKLIEDNSIKAIIATSGLTATNQGSYVELSGAALESSIAAKQDQLSTGNPSDPSHVKLLEGNAVKAVIATGGLTATDRGSYVEISGSGEGAALESRITDIERVVTVVPNNSFNYLETGTAALVIRTPNGPAVDILGSLNPSVEGKALFYNDVQVLGDLIISGGTLQTKLDGKQDKVANVSDTEIGYLSNVTSDIQAQLNQREPLYTTISPIVKNLNLSTGDIELKLDSTVSTTDLNNIIGTSSGVQSQLNAKQNLLNNGSDITVNVGRGDVYLENNANDNTSGAGVTLRTTDNPSNTAGSIFAVRSSGQAARLWVGQTITTTGDNQFHCGYTGASGEENDTTKYKHSLTDTAVTFGTPVTCQYDLQCGDLTANAIYGGAIFQIQNAIAAHTPYFAAGRIASSGSALSSKGSVSFTSTQTATGQYTITFASAHPDGADYVVQLTPKRTAETAGNEDIEVVYNSTTSTELFVQTRHHDDGSGPGTLVNNEFCFLVL